MPAEVAAPRGPGSSSGFTRIYVTVVAVEVVVLAVLYWMGRHFA
jgi:hypothetical protein